MDSSVSLDRARLEAVARLFKVLAEPTRLQILHCLHEQPCSVMELVEKVASKQANVSKQLGILYEAGLLARERRGSQVYYSIRETMIFDLCNLVCNKLRRDGEQLAQAFRATPEA